MGDSNEYPSWRKALFGNGHAANLYCAAKYAFWHAAHLLLAAGVLLVYVSVKAYRGIKRGVGYVLPDEAPPVPNLGVARRVRYVTESSAGKKVSRVLTALIAGVFLIVGIVGLVIIAIEETFVFVESIATAVGFFALSLAWSHLGLTDRVFAVLDRAVFGVATAGRRVVRAGGTVRQKSEKKPLARRLLGYCPVSMDIDPRWYDNISEKMWDEIEGDDDTTRQDW